MTDDVLARIARLREPALIAPHLQVREGGGELLAYIDGRAVEDILDEVVGADRWSFHLTGDPVVELGMFVSVRGELRIHTDERDIVRGDVGTGRMTANRDTGEIRPDSFGTAAKGAASDCLKRCSVQLGLGRCLYRLSQVKHRGRLDDRTRDQVIAKWRTELLGFHPADGPAERWGQLKQVLGGDKMVAEAFCLQHGVGSRDDLMNDQKFGALLAAAHKRNARTLEQRAEAA